MSKEKRTARGLLYGSRKQGIGPQPLPVVEQIEELRELAYYVDQITEVCWDHLLEQQLIDNIGYDAFNQLTQTDKQREMRKIADALEWQDDQLLIDYQVTRPSSYSEEINKITLYHLAKGSEEELLIKSAKRVIGEEKGKWLLTGHLVDSDGNGFTFINKTLPELAKEAPASKLIYQLDSEYKIEWLDDAQLWRNING